MNFESEYVNLLIKQYWEKPKAAAEIGMKAGAWHKTDNPFCAAENSFWL